jgi:hypothetical protein
MNQGNEMSNYLVIAKRVLAELEGEERSKTAVPTEVCWHCGGSLSCSCAICGRYAHGMVWIKGQCQCCKGTGHLALGRLQ